MWIADCGMRIENFPSPFRGRGLGEGKENPLEEILSRLTLNEIPSVPKKILFQGEGTGGMASYTAGWMASRGIEVIVLDGANRFNPYIVSAFARRALIAPEEILKKIRIARAFTCYQMTTLMERLGFLLKTPGTSPRQKIQVILLGLLNTFLDEDVPEREARLLLERTLNKMEEMSAGGVPFFFFQSPVSHHSKRAFLMKRLFQFSDLVWSVSLEEQKPKMILGKRRGLNTSLQIENCNMKNGNSEQKDFALF